MEEMRELSENLGVSDDVTFTGRLENPYPLLKQCSALVLLSDYEGTPLTVDEAKVLGVPILARDVGGIREQLVNGEYGEILDNFTSYEEIVKKILKLKKLKLKTEVFIAKYKKESDMLKYILKTKVL